MKRFLTPKEEKVLNFIEKYQFKNGASPTLKEMRLYMKLKSDGFVVHCLERLAAKGVIKKTIRLAVLNFCLPLRSVSMVLPGYCKDSGFRFNPCRRTRY